MTNTVFLRGRVGKDPIIKDKLTAFSIACTQNYKDKSGEWKEATTWVNIKTFNVLPVVPQKGNEVVIEGEIANNNWEKSDGTKVYETYVKARSVHLLKEYEKINQTKKAKEPEEDGLPWD